MTGIESALKVWEGSFDAAPIETAIISGIAILTFTGTGKILAQKIAGALAAALLSSDIIYIVKTAFTSLITGASVEGTLALFSTFQIALAGIGTIISGLFASVSSFVSMFINGFSWIKEIIMIVGIALVAVGAIILGAPALLAGVVAAIVAAVASLVIVVKDNWEQISSFFTNMATAFSEIWNALVYVFTTNFLPELERGFKNTINGIIGFFEGMANGVINAINFIIKGLNKIKFDVPY